MQRTVVLNVVGLSADLLGENTPFLSRWMSAGKSAYIGGVLPAVTCSVQATYLTGTMPSEHGIVGNGWYFRDECEVRFWRQSDKLVQVPRLWEEARRRNPSFTVANLFWWYAMYAATDWLVTPRPMYPADGRKLPDIYTQPPALRFDLQKRLGPFPLFEFWGPRTTIGSTRWIARAAMEVESHHQPTLSLVYLPHLDYGLQRLGPDAPGIARDLREVDAVCEELIGFFEARGVQVLVLSEYGITPVRRPVALNRILREAGFIAIREELGRELLDAGASRAFVAADHQVAHVYVNDPAIREEVRALVSGAPGVEAVLGPEEQRAAGIAHARAGEFVAVAAPDAWFSYYYWLDDARAPDYARTVDIHRKPGYDPAELFIDPALPAPALRAALRLAQKKLGFRYLMDLTPLDASLVRGSHGRLPDRPESGALLASRRDDLVPEGTVAPTDVRDLILAHIFADQHAPVTP